MIPVPSHTRVYLALGAMDMRKEINGLSMFVEGTLALDVFSGHLFVFCNRRRTTLKILFWDRNGFALYQKRLEKHRFKWPESREEVLQVTTRELSFLLEGLDLKSVHPHRELRYETLI
jgi:transposase